MKKKRPGFRQLEKERLALQVPPEIASLVRLSAVEERESVSEHGSKLLAIALGVDPQAYGIHKPRKPKPSKAVAT